jgi:hypothetical protein
VQAVLGKAAVTRWLLEDCAGALGRLESLPYIRSYHLGWWVAGVWGGAAAQHNFGSVFYKSSKVWKRSACVDLNWVKEIMVLILFFATKVSRRDMGLK